MPVLILAPRMLQLEAQNRIYSNPLMVMVEKVIDYIFSNIPLIYTGQFPQTSLPMDGGT